MIDMRREKMRSRSSGGKEEIDVMPGKVQF